MGEVSRTYLISVNNGEELTVNATDFIIEDGFIIFTGVTGCKVLSVRETIVNYIKMYQ